MALTKMMLDELTGDCKTPQDVEKLYSQMLQHMINRALDAEMQDLDLSLCQTSQA